MPNRLAAARRPAASSRGSSARRSHGESFNKGKLDAAAFDLSETLKREPTNAVALLTRAMVYSAKVEQVARDWRPRALRRRDAKNASGYVQRGIVLLKQTEPDRAIADLTQASALGANTRDVLADAYHQRALCALQGGANGRCHRRLRRTPATKTQRQDTAATSRLIGCIASGRLLGAGGARLVTSATPAEATVQQSSAQSLALCASTHKAACR